MNRPTAITTPIDRGSTTMPSQNLAPRCSSSLTNALALLLVLTTLPVACSGHSDGGHGRAAGVAVIGAGAAVAATDPSPTEAFAAAGSTAPLEAKDGRDDDTDVRWLDDYGNAVQLQHAQAAATKQGRSVLAVRLPSWHRDEGADKTTPAPRRLDTQEGTGGLAAPRSMTWIVYPAECDDPCEAPLQRYGHRRRRRRSACEQSLIHILARSPGEVPAIVCSGVSGDIASLVDSLQSYLVGIWSRYDDTEPSADIISPPDSAGILSNGLAHAIFQLQQSFWGWNDASDDDDANRKGSFIWQSSCWRLNDKRNRWARPMGLQALVISGIDLETQPLQLIQPFGMIRSFPRGVAWLGRYSEANERNAKLQEALETLVTEACHFLRKSQQERTSANHADRSLWSNEEDAWQHQLLNIVSKEQAFGTSCRAVVIEKFDPITGMIQRQVLSFPLKETS